MRSNGKRGKTSRVERNEAGVVRRDRRNSTGCTGSEVPDFHADDGQPDDVAEYALGRLRYHGRPAWGCYLTKFDKEKHKRDAPDTFVFT